eukprot:m.241689 g.241689  ORF g.241689 m.241689 type:complete len:912 (+) comp24679_c0_seq1:14-2749(+)
MAAPTAAEVVAAVTAMHHDPDPQRKHAADTWLKEFQSSKQAWEVSDALLRQETAPEEVHYFAAQTLKTKITRYFHELPADAHDSLRAALFQHLYNFHAAHAVSVQLCVAIADLIIHLASWKSSLKDILTILAEQKFATTAICLLTEIPDEVNNSYLRVSDERRREIGDELGLNSAQVFAYLMQCWQQSGEDMRARIAVLKCLRNWLKFGGEGSVGIESASLGLVDALFKALFVIELQEYAGPAIESLILLSRDTVHHAGLRAAVTPFVSSLLPHFRTTIAESDEDFGRVLGNIFVSFCETEVKAFALAPQGSEVGELMLLCCEHPEFLVGRTTFTFWFDLGDIVASERALGAGVAPFYQRLLGHLARLVQCPEGQTGLLSARDELYEFRADTRDLICDTVFMVGSTRAFAMFTQHISQPQQPWPVVEGGMFLLACLAGRLPRDDDATIGALLSFIATHTPTAHVAVKSISLELIGHLADWICKHDDSIMPLFNIIYDAFQNSLLVRNAAFALKSLFSEGRGKMRILLPAVHTVLATPEIRLHDNDIAELIKGAARVIACLEPAADIATEAARFCDPCFAMLSKCTQGAVPHSPQKALENLGNFFRHANVVVPTNLLPDGSHPLFTVAQQAWSYCGTLVRAHEGDHEVAEDCFRCIKWILRSLHLHAAPFVEPTASLLMDVYSRRRYSCCVYVASILVEIFGANPANAHFLYSLVSVFCRTTFTLIGSPLRALHASPELMEDFLRLVGRVLSLQPVLLLQDAELASLAFQYAIGSILIPNRDTNEIVSDVLIDFLNCCRLLDPPSLAPTMNTLLQTHGGQLVHMLLSAVAGGLPCFMVPDVSKVLWMVISVVPARPTVVEWALTTRALLPPLDPRLQQRDIDRLLCAIAEAPSVDDLRRELRVFARIFSPEE